MRKVLNIILLVVLAALVAGVQEINIIPNLNKVELAKGRFNLGSTRTTYYATPAEKEAAFLQNALRSTASTPFRRSWTNSTTRTSSLPAARSGASGFRPEERCNTRCFFA